MKTLENVAKEQIIEYYSNRYSSVYNCRNIEIKFDTEPVLDQSFTSLYVTNNHLQFSVECKFSVSGIDTDGSFTDEFNGFDVQYPIGLKTPKGYFSKKKLPVSFEYQKEETLTVEQATELLNYHTDAKENKFDPFYAQHQAESKNAAAWNYIAQNFITDPYERG